MRKKILSALLAVAVAFAGLCGCGDPAVGGAEGTEYPAEAGGTGNSAEVGKASGSGGMGRFLEQETSFPENMMIFGMEKLEDGTVRVLGQSEESGQYVFYDSADDGDSWVSAGEVSGLSDFFPEAGAVSSDGSGVLVMTHYKDETAEMVILDPGQEARRVMLTIPEVSASRPENLKVIVACAFDAEGRFFIESLNSHIFQVDLSTGECREFSDMEESYSRNIGIAGNWLFALSGGGVAIFNSEDGSQVEDAFLNDLFAKNPALGEKNTDFGAGFALAGGTADEIFYVTHEGLFVHSIGGSVAEQLIDGALNTMGNTSALFYHLVMLDEENFLVSVHLNRKTTVLKYTYDSSASAVPETELKVYALNDSNYLRQVMSDYQKKHQDVYVNLTIGMSGDDGVTAEDAIRALNTDILAGNGPDVLILDGLPMDSYIEKGVLADIASLIQEMRESDGFFENVAAAYEKDGAVYGFPAKFYVMLAGGTAEATAAGASLQKMADYVEASGGTYGQSGAKSLLQELYPVSSAGFLSGNKLNEDKIKQFLIQSKRLYTPTEYGDVELYDGGMADELVGTYGTVSILMGESCISCGSIASMNGLVLEAAASAQGGFDYGLAGREDSKSFVPYQIAGIGSGTANRDAAEDFLRALFGKDCGSIDGNGFPVNRSAYEALCEYGMNMFGETDEPGVSVSSTDGTSLSLEMKNATEEQIAKLTGILEEADTPAQTDKVIEDIIMEYGESALRGDIGVDEAVLAILQKCNLYLAE